MPEQPLLTLRLPAVKESLLQLYVIDDAFLFLIVCLGKHSGQAYAVDTLKSTPYFLPQPERTVQYLYHLFSYVSCSEMLYCVLHCFQRQHYCPVVR